MRFALLAVVAVMSLGCRFLQQWKRQVSKMNLTHELNCLQNQHCSRWQQSPTLANSFNPPHKKAKPSRIYSPKASISLALIHLSKLTSSSPHK
jgi:hypothetical protein